MAIMRVLISFHPESTEMDGFIEHLEAYNRTIDLIRRKSWQIIAWANKDEIKIAIGLFRATVVYLKTDGSINKGASH